MDTKIQSTPAVSAQAQEPLASDADNRTRGGNFNQNTMSVSRGAEVNFGSAPQKISPGQVNGVGDIAPSGAPSLGVAGVNVSVQPVDRKTIEGSYPGDSRKIGAPAVLPANPGPREPMTQAPLRRGE